MTDIKNYPRYPVDLFRAQIIFVTRNGEEAPQPIIIADIVRENPFGRAFERKGNLYDV